MLSPPAARVKPLFSDGLDGFYVQAAATTRSDGDRDDQGQELVGRGDLEAGGYRTGGFVAHRHLLPVDAKLGCALRRHAYCRRGWIVDEKTAAADDVRGQWIGVRIEQLRAREAEEAAAHVQLIGKSEGPHQVAGPGVGADQRQRQSGGVATLA